MVSSVTTSRRNRYRYLLMLRTRLKFTHQSQQQNIPSILPICTPFHPRRSSQDLPPARSHCLRRLCHRWRWYLRKRNYPFHLSLLSRSQTLSHQLTILADLRPQKPYFPSPPSNGSGAVIFPRSFRAILSQAIWARSLYQSLPNPQFLKLRSIVPLLRAKRRVCL